MKKNSRILKCLLYLTVAALLLCTLPVLAMGAEDPLTLNIADGAITITSTGYTVGSGEETPYTGSYILTGTANTTDPYNVITVNGVAEGAVVTLKDLDVSTNGPSSVTTSVDPAGHRDGAAAERRACTEL